MNWFVNSQVVFGEDPAHETLVVRQGILRLCRVNSLAAMLDNELKIQSLRAGVFTYLSFFLHQTSRLRIQEKERDQGFAIWFKDSGNLRHVSLHLGPLHVREDRR